MDWRADIKKIGNSLSKKVGMSFGVAGIVALGFTGTGTSLATVAAAQPRSLSSNQAQSLLSEDSTQLSLNLFELLGNVFRYIQVSNISDSEEIAIGQRINRMILQQQYRLYNDPQIQSYVSRLGQRLVSASDSRDIPFNFQVVASDEINAFAVPGGFVYVTTGLLQAVENEAQLASVLAHEISHINQRHSIEAIKRATLAQGIAETANIETSTLAQIGYQLAIDLPRSRDFEYAADQGGLEILREAGYPPMAFINFLEILNSSAAQPEFLRTHPTSENRIRELRNQITASDDSTDLGMQESQYEQMITPLN